MSAAQTISLERSSELKITWVNHAGFFLSYKNATLLVDPWLKDSVFNHGWKSLVTIQITPESWQNVDYIWCSHEHPDHFNVPSLMTIPAEERKRIKFLFHKTIDKRVISFVTKAGFQPIEIPPGETHSILDDFTILNNPVGTLDSYALYTVNGLRILNLNDCVLNSTERYKALYKQVGSHVDILMTIFGFAKKTGNPQDDQLREAESRSFAKSLSLQYKIFSPEWVIPFAAFKYFSSTENRYLNKGFLEINDFVRILEKEFDIPTSKLAVLFPNQQWDFKSQPPTAEALRLYQSIDLDKSNESFAKPAFVEIEKLKEKNQKFIDNIRKDNNLRLLKLLSLAPKRFSIRPVTLYLLDLDMLVRIYYDRPFRVLKEHVSGQRFYNVDLVLDWDAFIQWSTESKLNFDVAISSDSFGFMLDNNFGGSTLDINGRYYYKDEASYRLFNNFNLIGLLNSNGFSLNHKFVVNNIKTALREWGIQDNLEYEPSFVKELES